MNDTKLKPCPFCGGEANLKYHVDPEGKDFDITIVYCTNCSAAICGYDDLLIVRKWNMRAAAEAHLYTLNELIQLKPLTAVYLEECDDPESECHVTEWIGSLRVKADNNAHVEPYTQMLFKNYSEAAEEYGSYWRCWSSRPTEARMRATQWQGARK